ncbi:PREDICTED: uncharacterized protein LOC105359962 [Ceratosolen solmsi marchali]|uniref:Uncharacterized protein LOC105359962 n=1 Tax=Ceratosolen solmsi marchali TaxID=326594 RepID=A0AAJ6VMD3_9HYME|nr:PREDICTED: uncharacterized protein LOC105359962 [Ceratosolen solmsi marchali]
MITWLMVGLLLFTESGCDRGKNAVSKTNGKKENESGIAVNDKSNAKDTAIAEENIYRLTCYTCVNVSDNKMCNEWAIDTPCPVEGRDFCRSLHILDSRGQSVLVSKSCVSKIECSPASVGCVPIDTQKICISCCDTSYCNIESPTNMTNATFSRKRPKPKNLKKKAKNDEEDKDETSKGSSVPGLAPLVTAFSAISVFLNQAYH